MGDKQHLKFSWGGVKIKQVKTNTKSERGCLRNVVVNQATGHKKSDNYKK
jgi:hypothetical protein